MGERKVRPIYEALDARNFKLALKLCAGALQKPGPHHSLVTALKGVTLQRMGRLDEALAACRLVAGKSPPETDETVLHTLLLVFKAAGCAHEGAACFEAAFHAAPSNAELGHSLFFVHLRSEEWGRAQLLAMRLYKQFGARYMRWAVVCLVLQADAACAPVDPSRLPLAWAAGATPAPPAGEAPPRVLQLAAAMLSKAEGELESESELQLHLAVWQRLRQPEAALALLQAKGSLVSAEVQRYRTEALLLEELERWEEARAVAAKMVRCAPDDWEAYRLLVRCSVRHGDSAAARALVGEMCAEYSSHRAPLWASILLEYAARMDDEAACDFLRASRAEAGGAAEARGGGAAELAPLQRALSAYFEAFSTKPCCFLDTKDFLRGVSDPACFIGAMEADFHSRCGDEPPSPPSLDWLLKYVCLNEWRLGCGACDDIDEERRLRLCARWVAVYEAHRPLSAELDSRERGRADPLLLLAAQLMCNAPTGEWFNPASPQSAISTRALLAASIVLRAGLDASPHNFQLSLAQTQCLLCLGAPSAAYAIYRGCDVKHIQHESLSYLILPALSELGAAPQAEEALRVVRHFQQEGLKDMVDSLSVAFRSGNYVQALDFVAFKRSLRSSWWQLLTSVAFLFHEVMAKQANAAEVALLLTEASDVLSSDMSAAALHALPSPLDGDVFEDHSPRPRGARQHALLHAYLPRRALLLRLLQQALARDGAALAATGAALERELRGEGEEWAAACALSRACVRLAQLEAAPEESRALDEFAAEAGAAVDGLAARCAELSRRLLAEEGYGVRAVHAAAQVAQLELPLLTCVGQLWAAQLPGSKKGKKKQGVEAAQDGGHAPPSGVRDGVRDRLASLVARLSELEAALRTPTLRSEAVRTLEAEEWERWLGGFPAIEGARASLRATLLESSAANLSSVADSVRLGLAALRQVVKSM